MGGYWNLLICADDDWRDQAACWMGGYWNMSAILGKTVSDQAAC